MATATRLASRSQSKAMATGETTGARPRFGELDGLRGLAALTVVLAHFNPAPLMPSRQLFRGFFETVDRGSLANLGVVFFFVLSAFLLTYLGVREFDAYDRFDVGKFYVRRTFRIWPLYFAILALNMAMSAPVALLGTVYSLDAAQWEWMKAHLWFFATFLSNWSLTLNHVAGYVDRSSPPLAILWSIAVEEQFYLFFPLLLYAALRSPRNFRIVAISLLAIGFIFRFVFPRVPVDTRALGPSGGMYYATLSYADVFLAGGIAGWIAARGLERGSTWRSWMSRRGAGTVLLLAMLLVSTAWRGQLWYPYALYSTVLYPVTAALFAATILWTLVNARAPTSHALRSAPMRILGVLSYGIYLWHPIAAAAVKIDLESLVPIKQDAIDFLSVISLSGYLAATICGAALTYLLIERPFLRLKDRFVPGSRAPRERARAPFDLQWAMLIGSVSMCILLAGETAIRTHFGAFARTRVASMLLPIAWEQAPLEDAKGLTVLFVREIQKIPFEEPQALFGGGASGASERAFLVGTPGDLLLVRATGRVARLVARDGQRIRLSNVGEWDSATSGLKGLEAISLGGRWVVDARALRPLNRNNFLSEGNDTAPIPGFWMSPAGAMYTIKRMQDQDGRFVRVTATKPSPYLMLTGRDPLPALDGVPVSIRGQIRARSDTARMVLSLFEVAPRDEQAKNYRTQVDPAGRWTTLVVGTERTDHDPRDNFSLGLVGVEAGDWFDIRELSVFKGIVP
jgi:peptidoglycan/LPS O-acetylase OafA/YrhL